MIATCVLFGLLSATTLIIVFHRLPSTIQNLLLRFPLFTELLTFLVLYKMVSSITSSIIGMGTTLIAGVAWTAYFMYLKNKDIDNGHNHQRRRPLPLEPQAL